MLLLASPPSPVRSWATAASMYFAVQSTMALRTRPSAAALVLHAVVVDLPLVPGPRADPTDKTSV
ncbi:hypothetical protein [Streptomyces melanogenes]|uniref:hypothetical protein n=1 Tax=Streptomyces melanogenes TaxID=67326 RepID=UPI0037910DD5